MADQGSEGLLSPFLRSKRFQTVRPYLNGRVLDFGCGSGGLAEFVSEKNYIGVDIDNFSLSIARARFPRHLFCSALDSIDNGFDTVVSLAVIEHCQNPGRFLNTLSKYLNELPTSKIILTTPHPCVDWIHRAGSFVGLFSKHANEEHETLLNRTMFDSLISHRDDLVLTVYKKFLFGANQMLVLKRQS